MIVCMRSIAGHSPALHAVRTLAQQHHVVKEFEDLRRRLEERNENSAAHEVGKVAKVPDNLESCRRVQSCGYLVLSRQH